MTSLVSSCKWLAIQISLPSGAENSSLIMHEHWTNIWDPDHIGHCVQVQGDDQWVQKDLSPK